MNASANFIYHMKHSYKYFVSAVLTVAFLVPTASFAQGNEATIAALLEQIKQLQAQVAMLQAQQMQTQSDMATVSELAKTLREGAQGDDVRVVQALLAADPTVYPEGVISGQYGQSTTNAVKRFQAKHGLPQAGSIDEKTLKKLNEMLEEDDAELLIVRSGTGTDAVVCHRTPPGHFIAPGWQRRQGGNRPIVPDCQTLPPGIAKKLMQRNGGTPTPNVDVIPPTVMVTSPFGGATISRTILLRAHATDNVRVAGVQFLVDNAYVGGEDIASPYMAVWNSLGVANGTHTITAVARDTAGNRATSSPVSIIVNNRNFATTTRQDVTSPIIFGLRVEAITASTASVTWMTNEVATTKVYYSTTAPVATSTALVQDVSGNTTFHRIDLTQLEAGRTYHLLVVSADAAGNMATRQTSFTTSSVGDTTAPLITNVVSSTTGNTTANISWMTNEPATTKVYYSTVSPVSTGTALFQEVSGTRMSHSVNLAQLAAGTTYYVLIVSTDLAGNTSSVPTSLVTPPSPDTTPPAISNVVSSGIGSTTANISWTTNEAATGKVYYGTTSPLLLAGSSVATAAVFATNQSVNLSALIPNTPYNFVVVANDAENNQATSTQFSLVTTN